MSTIIFQQEGINILLKNYAYKGYGIEKLLNGMSDKPSYEFWVGDEQVLAFDTLKEIKKHIDKYDPMSTYICILTYGYNKDIISKIKGEIK